MEGEGESSALEQTKERSENELQSLEQSLSSSKRPQPAPWRSLDEWACQDSAEAASRNTFSLNRAHCACCLHSHSRSSEAVQLEQAPSADAVTEANQKRQEAEQREQKALEQLKHAQQCEHEARTGLETLRERLQSLENESKDVSRVYEQLRDLRSKLRTKAKEADDNSQRASAAEANVSELSTQIEREQSRAAVAESERDEEAKRATALETQVSELRYQMAEVDTAKHEAEQREGDLQQEVDRLRAKLSALDATAVNDDGENQDCDCVTSTALEGENKNEPGANLDSVVVRMQQAAQNLGLQPCASIAKLSSQVGAEVNAVASALPTKRAKLEEADEMGMQKANKPLHERVHQMCRENEIANNLYSKLEHAFKNACSSQQQSKDQADYSEMIDSLRDELLDSKAQLAETTQLVERIDKLENEMEGWKKKAELQEADASQAREESQALSMKYNSLEEEAESLKETLRATEEKLQQREQSESQLRYERDVKVNRIEELREALADAIGDGKSGSCNQNASTKSRSEQKNEESAVQTEDVPSEHEQELFLERGSKWASLKLLSAPVKTAVEERIAYLLSFSPDTSSTGVDELVHHEGLALSAGALALAVQRAQFASSPVDEHITTHEMNKKSADECKNVKDKGIQSEEVLETIEQEVLNLLADLSHRVLGYDVKPVEQKEDSDGGINMKMRSILDMIHRCRDALGHGGQEESEDDSVHCTASCDPQQMGAKTARSDSAESNASTVAVPNDAEHDIRKLLQDKELELSKERETRQQLEQQRDQLEEQQAELENLLSRAEAAEQAITNSSDHQDMELLQSKLSEMEKEVHDLRAAYKEKEQALACAEVREEKTLDGSDHHALAMREGRISMENCNTSNSRRAIEMENALLCVEKVLQGGDMNDERDAAAIAKDCSSDSEAQCMLQRCLHLALSLLRYSEEDHARSVSIDVYYEEQSLRKQLQERIDYLLQQVEDLSKELNEEYNSESVGVLSSQLNAAETKQQQLEEQVEYWKGEYEAAVSQRDNSIADGDRERQRLIQHIVEQETTIATLQEQLQVAADVAAECGRSVQVHEEESVHAFEHRLDDVHNGLRNIFNQSCENISNLKSRIDELTEDCKQKDDEIERVAAQLEETRDAERMRLQESLNEARRDAECAANEASRLRSELSSTSQSRNKLYEQLQEAQESLNNAITFRNAAEEEKEELHKSNSRKDSELSDAHKQRENAQQLISQMHAILKDSAMHLQTTAHPASCEIDEPLTAAQSMAKYLENLQREKDSIEQSEKDEKDGKGTDSPPHTDMSQKQLEHALQQKQREARELRYQLKAADDARAQKDRRIGYLLHNIKELNDEVQDKAHTIERLQSKVARSKSLSPASV